MLLTATLLSHESDSGTDLLKVLTHPVVASKSPRYETDWEIYKLLYPNIENSIRNAKGDWQRRRDYSQKTQRDGRTEYSMRDANMRYANFTERVPSQTRKAASGCHVQSSCHSSSSSYSSRYDYYRNASSYSRSYSHPSSSSSYSRRNGSSDSEACLDFCLIFVLVFFVGFIVDHHLLLQQVGFNCHLLFNLLLQEGSSDI
ncbi:uncharacterized protein MONOS_1498 [Monocercomonoides exilis]|uniref:uncharacterized protein n=1 Tax=Monocercomonoides exilis TaxID=2049356 RepID=UPI003559E1C1|nr:hypothetical protein MONOS_1498 [Monocercomonoides exilis]|eukprot:MONOS_1498.1-p1 / transcript=MONOS_1498.1 / gene=MONOS_1498 / organism=Monocercomonoides_exilis_PA203 / gene_product=unspecified product / transcript_product=unspecified product / location=Mono_scaffold00026:179255-179923(+) / protein_length=201 / sequence_SO=supercontig / SO=protein_coding / is_pseudo=false